MTNVLHARFLELPEEYEQAEQVWRDGFSELVERIDPASNWDSPWMSSAFADGSPIRDGNPIFSARCPEKKLGVRVIQNSPGNGSSLSYWIDVFGEGDPEETRELVISCVLTTQTLHQALALMSQWITRGEIVARERTTAGPVDAG